MKAVDIKPGMFILISAPPLMEHHLILFIVSDDLETAIFRTVDITGMKPSFLSYRAVLRSTKRFDGYDSTRPLQLQVSIDTAKKKVIEAAFNKPSGKK